MLCLPFCKHSIVLNRYFFYPGADFENEEEHKMSGIRIHITKIFFINKDWDSVREINSYPPATGAYALYMKSTFYELFNNTADTYFHLEENAINPIFKVNCFLGFPIIISPK